MRNNWGRCYLMCPPSHFTVEYAINPWMTPDDPADPVLAMKQWSELVTTIEDAGGAVETIDGHETLPDMVFTANLGVVSDGTFVRAAMRHPERAREPELAGYWAAGRGFDVQSIPASAGSFEGMGDALPFGSGFIAGFGPRSMPGAWEALSEQTGWAITALELPDDRFYHIDLVFSPLNDRQALIAPIGLTDDALATIVSLVAEPILLTDQEAAQFSANSIVVDNTVIMPACSERLRGLIEEAGFDVAVVNVSEFLKAGGAVRCLTLPLDVSLDPNTVTDRA